MARKIIINYADPHFGVVDVQLPKSTLPKIKNLLKEKYSKYISLQIESKKENVRICIIDLLSGGMRQQLLQLLGFIKKPINISQATEIISEIITEKQKYMPYGHPKIKVHYTQILRELKVFEDFELIKLIPEGKETKIILQAKIIPASKYFDYIIKHPENEISKCKSQLQQAKIAEQNYNKIIEACKCINKEDLDKKAMTNAIAACNASVAAILKKK